MMDNWEYQVVDLASCHSVEDEIKLLNIYGDEGWELVSVTHVFDSYRTGNEYHRAFFKRRIIPNTSNKI